MLHVVLQDHVILALQVEIFILIVGAKLDNLMLGHYLELIVSVKNLDNRFENLLN